MNTKIHLSIVSPNNPILRKKALSIPPRKIQSPEIQKLIEGLLDVAYGEQKDAKKPVLVGFAAPQVGVSQRIILVDVGADGHGGVSDLRVYINPRIVRKSRRREEWYEGCFSTDRVCGIVCRPQAVTIEAYTGEGKHIQENHSGYIARFFSMR